MIIEEVTLVYTIAPCVGTVASAGVSSLSYAFGALGALAGVVGLTVAGTSGIHTKSSKEKQD